MENGQLEHPTENWGVEETNSKSTNVDSEWWILTNGGFWPMVNQWWILKLTNVDSDGLEHSKYFNEMNLF